MKVTIDTIEAVFGAEAANEATMKIKGFELVETLFVDSSGFGREDEPALTVDQAERRVRAIIAEHGPLDARIIDQGQFQVWLGLFKKTGKPAKRLAGSTYLYTNSAGERVVRLYDTDIITEHADDTITLDSGGFNTTTTAKRMNEFSSAHVTRKNWVMQSDGEPFEANKITVKGWITA